MIHFTKQDQKAFHAVVARYQNSNVFNKLGYCFKMHYQLTGQLMWVTSSKLLGEQEKSQKKKLSAERCIPRKGKKVISELDVAKLHTTDSGIAFINCDADDQEKNYLKFGCYGTLPKEAFAYVLDGKEMRGLKFVKTGDGAVTYTFQDSPSSDKASKEFEMIKSVGSPIIFEVYPPERNQVVGILNIEADGTLNPVFFDLKTFNLDQKSPSEDSCQSQKSPIKESNGDKTDSLTHACKESANGDEKDSPIAAFQDSANDDKTDSPGLVDVLTDSLKQTHLDEKNYNDQQPTQEDKQSIGELAISKSSNSTLLHASRCIKNETLAMSPITHQLTQELMIYLDPKRPIGKDWQDLADSFGCNNVRIQYLGTRDSPTVTLLNQNNQCTIEQLRGKLKDMGRDDTVDVIDELVKKQGCNCDNCGSLR